MILVYNGHWHAEKLSKLVAQTWKCFFYYPMIKSNVLYGAYPSIQARHVQDHRLDPSNESNFASSFPLMSVAITLAPSSAKVTAVVRPIPCAAAVQSTVLPCKRRDECLRTLEAILLCQSRDHPTRISYETRTIYEPLSGIDRLQSKTNTIMSIHKVSQRATKQDGRHRLGENPSKWR